MNEHPAVLEWRRAEECLGAAFLCTSGGFYADAISRAYYAVLHAAKSVLRLRGIDARSHTGVMNLFGSNMILTDLIEVRWSNEIDFLHELRIEADYRLSSTFAEADARQSCERAQAFLNRIRPLLAGTVPIDEM